MKSRNRQSRKADEIAAGNKDGLCPESQGRIRDNAKPPYGRGETQCVPGAEVFAGSEGMDRYI
jgi:hypothetical protein